MEDNGKLFRTNRESLKLRVKKKTLGKTTWFKTKPDRNQKVGGENSTGGKMKSTKVDTQRKSIKKDNNVKVNNTMDNKKEVNTAAVLFVDLVAGFASLFR